MKYFYRQRDLLPAAIAPRANATALIGKRYAISTSFEWVLSFKVGMSGPSNPRVNPERN
jgi:hypothetical protein